jgi:hypothetical protein
MIVEVNGILGEIKILSPTCIYKSFEYVIEVHSFGKKTNENHKLFFWIFHTLNLN